MAVGFPSRGIFNGGELYARRFARRLERAYRLCMSVPVHRGGRQLTVCILHVLENMQEAVLVLVGGDSTATLRERDTVARRHHIDSRYHLTLRVIPVSDDVCSRFQVVYPTVPHHLMGVKRILGNAHRVYNSAHTVVIGRASVGLCIAEHNLHTARIDFSSTTGTLQPVFIPAVDKLTGKLILIMIIRVCGCVAVQRAVAFLVIRVAPRVPIPAQGFVTAIFHHPHRLGVALVHIKHLAAILGLRPVKHLTAAYRTASVGVILVSYRLHGYHVPGGYALVSALIEYDTRIVAVVYYGIAHKLFALFPATAVDIFLGIAGRHGLYQANTVARLDILFPRGDVHPAHHIAAALDHEIVRVVAEPCRNRHSHARPFVACALSIAMHHHHTVVQIEHSVLELGLAEARNGSHLIGDERRRGGPSRVPRTGG